MNKQTRTMVVAGVMALVVAFLFQMTGSPEKPKIPDVELPPIESLPTSQVVIAKAFIPAFSPEPIQKRMVQEVSFPAGLQPASAAVNTTSVENKIAVEDIYAKEIISLTRISDPALIHKSIATQLGRNERAITIQVDGVSAGGGFVQQGDTVDIIALYPQGTTNDLFCKVIMQSVKILAVGTVHTTQLKKNADGLIRGMSGAPVNITVAAQALDAFRIQHLRQRATFRMVLKNPHDKDDVETSGDYFKKLLERNLPEHFRPKLTTMEKVISIEVIEGVSQSSQQVVVPVVVEEEL